MFKGAEALIYLKLFSSSKCEEFAENGDKR